MPDYPNTLVRPSRNALSTYGATSLAMDAAQASSPNTSSVAWPTNNLGIFVPVWVERPVTVFQMAIIVGTQSGNVDVGIYDVLGNRLVRAGSTAVAAAGVQPFDIADTALMPGIYFLAMACSTTAAFFRATSTTAVTLRSVGVQSVANAFSTGLIDPVTYAGTTSAYLPLLTASLVATI